MDVGYEMFTSDMMEDKFAGTMLIKAGLVSRAESFKSGQASGLREIQRVEDLFNKGLVVGWAVTDSLCGRVLTQVLQLTAAGALASYTVWSCPLAIRN
jgi:hypothetical protein